MACSYHSGARDSFSSTAAFNGCWSGVFSSALFCSDLFDLLCIVCIMQLLHRAELCDTSGILTGAMALNLKHRDDKGHDTKKKNNRMGKDPPAFYFFHSLTI